MLVNCCGCHCRDRCPCCGRRYYYTDWWYPYRYRPVLPCVPAQPVWNGVGTAISRAQSALTG